MKEQVLVCPVCGGALLRTERQYTCPAGHSFDVAKEGYVNLLCTSKSADKMGDSKESAAARHAFLERGYYGCLKEALTPLLHGNVPYQYSSLPPAYEPNSPQSIGRRSFA